MTRSRNTLLWDRYGDLRVGWFVAACLTSLIAILLGLVLAIGKPISEAACNQRELELEVVAGDYRLWSATCYRMRRHRRRRAGFLLEHRDREVLGLPIEYPTRFYATRTPNKSRRR